MFFPIFLYTFAQKAKKMASKSVLIKAIEILEKANNTLNRTLLSTDSSSERERISKEITKNESMILDYKFRINHE